MRKLTCAIVAAGSVLVTGTTMASVATSSEGGGPTCNGAAFQGVIWPPDHKMVAETIVAMDPSLTITIFKIEQDEPVEMLGSGNTEPDGYINTATSTAYVRAERSGLGTGRMYFIWYTATDIYGQQCTGFVQAVVPHDQGQGSNAVDTQQRYDSTMLFD
jgi:hypothetical protein